MIYVLIVDKEGQIQIVDNSNSLGKRKVEKMIMEGCEPVGKLESELNRLALMSGFNKSMCEKHKKALDRIYTAIQALEG